MKRLLSKRIIEVGIDYDDNGHTVGYKLYHPRIDGHVNQTVFANKDFNNHRSDDTRAMYFFELERMIKILKDNPIVSTKTLEPICDYYDLRKKRYERVYGDWKMHDDSDYLSLVEEEQVNEAPVDEVIDLTANDEEKQPRQPQHRNPTEAQQYRGF